MARTVDDPVISAQAVCRPARAGDPDRPVTAETVAELAPHAEAAARARDWFAEQGFDVGELVGTSFAVTAPRSRFEATFGDHVKVEGAGAATGGAASVAGRDDRTLSLERLPETVAEALQAVAFSPPLDFGPGRY
ncbi:MAG: hypothetical protein ACRDU8_10940 [Egibacteraceae bacterium]